MTFEDLKEKKTLTHIDKARLNADTHGTNGINMQKAEEKNWIQIDFYFSRLKVNRGIHHLSRTGFAPGIKDSNHVE